MISDDNHDIGQLLPLMIIVSSKIGQNRLLPKKISQLLGKTS